MRKDMKISAMIAVEERIFGPCGGEIVCVPGRFGQACVRTEVRGRCEDGLIFVHQDRCGDLTRWSGERKGRRICAVK